MKKVSIFINDSEKEPLFTLMVHRIENDEPVIEATCVFDIATFGQLLNRMVDVYEKVAEKIGYSPDELAEGAALLKKEFGSEDII